MMSQGRCMTRFHNWLPLNLYTAYQRDSQHNPSGQMQADICLIHKLTVQPSHRWDIGSQHHIACSCWILLVHRFLPDIWWLCCCYSCNQQDIQYNLLDQNYFGIFQRDKLSRLRLQLHCKSQHHILNRLRLLL
ncbi:hypothetical protein DPMN_115104 [Dreissena polymorpha]|uniref:Uncharacterized protein n=1 Tax=Dreissena polymorpha TaxID=45954 RepID=A0A9D4KM82_DREPO|nr:hypothetical protein DPMN_115104 [Dreissena polymorpha]